MKDSEAEEERLRCEISSSLSLSCFFFLRSFFLSSLPGHDSKSNFACSLAACCFLGVVVVLIVWA
jgi:hypothetical protein